MSKLSHFVIALTLTLVIILVKKNMLIKNEYTSIKEGEKYLFSFDWDNKDPFKKIEIDTVIVIAIKGDYIQWEYNNGIRLSSKLEHFKMFQKPLNLSSKSTQSH